MRIERALTLGAGFNKKDLFHKQKKKLKATKRIVSAEPYISLLLIVDSFFPFILSLFLRLVCGSWWRRGKEEEGLRIRLRAPLQPAEGVRVFCLRRLPKWILRLHSSADKCGSFFGNLQSLSFVFGGNFIVLFCSEKDAEEQQERRKIYSLRQSSRQEKGGTDSLFQSRNIVGCIF